MATFRGGGDPTVGNTFASEAALTQAVLDAEASSDSALSSASGAAVSAGEALASQVAAAASEIAAAASETAAGLSETAAELAETNAEAAETNVEALYDLFDDLFLGSKASDPTLDNDGDALQGGALYYDNVNDVIKVYNGSSWDQAFDTTVLYKSGGTMTGTIAMNLNEEGNSSTALTIDWTLSNKCTCVMTGNATFTFTAPGDAANLVLLITQDATGSRTITWPAAVKWPGGTAPTLTTTANAEDICSFFYDGTSYYGAFGLDYS